MRIPLTRRSFLVGAAALSATALVGVRARADARAKRAGLVVLFELVGGNDGLHTVVPFLDPRYRALRPTIAHDAGELVVVDDGRGLAPGLAPLAPWLANGTLAVVEGVGITPPSRSHFKARDIWGTGSLRAETHGAFARLLAKDGVRVAEAIALGDDGSRPCANGRVLDLADPERFLFGARHAKTRVVDDKWPAALRHAVAVENDTARAADLLAKAGVERARRAPKGGDDGNLSQQLRQQIATLDALLAADVVVPLVHLRMKGFDTHAKEPARHAALMKDLGRALVALDEVLRRRGRFSDSAVLVFSEFGRRAAENKSRGTDHGTAFPALLFGGRVVGGLYGPPPDLGDLDDNGDLRVRVDFRALLATLARSVLEIDEKRVVTVLGRHEPLPAVRV